MRDNLSCFTSILVQPNQVLTSRSLNFEMKKDSSGGKGSEAPELSQFSFFSLFPFRPICLILQDPGSAVPVTCPPSPGIGLEALWFEVSEMTTNEVVNYLCHSRTHIQQVFTEHVLCARYRSGCCVYMCAQREFLPSKNLVESGERQRNEYRSMC